LKGHIACHKIVKVRILYLLRNTALIVVGWTESTMK
jgi:hypothetical protein